MQQHHGGGSGGGLASDLVEELWHVLVKLVVETWRDGSDRRRDRDEEEVAAVHWCHREGTPGINIARYHHGRRRRGVACF